MSPHIDYIKIPLTLQKEAVNSVGLFHATLLVTLAQYYPMGVFGGGIGAAQRSWPSLGKVS